MKRLQVVSREGVLALSTPNVDNSVHAIPVAIRKCLEIGCGRELAKKQPNPDNPFQSDIYLWNIGGFARHLDKPGGSVTAE
jgi:hypothetical protein